MIKITLLALPVLAALVACAPDAKPADRTDDVTSRTKVDKRGKAADDDSAKEKAPAAKAAAPSAATAKEGQACGGPQRIRCAEGYLCTYYDVPADEEEPDELPGAPPKPLEPEVGQCEKDPCVDDPSLCDEQNVAEGEPDPS